MKGTYTNTESAESIKAFAPTVATSGVIGHPVPVQPQMTEREIELFKNAVQGKKTIVEFGSGGSTFLLFELGAKRVVSVESDPEWVLQVREHELLAPHVMAGRLTVHHADIGPTGKWGYPTRQSLNHTWPTYWRMPWSVIEPTLVEMVFVDGRFRVACALNALLQGSPDLTIVVHDFWKRPQYQVLLHYLNCACRADNLAVFFAKRDINLISLKNDLEQHSLLTI